MGIIVYSLLWVMQGLYHQQYVLLQAFVQDWVLGSTWRFMGSYKSGYK